MPHSDLLKVTQNFFLPIYSHAVMIENQYGDFLKPPEQGIYKAGELFPSIISTKHYFSQRIDKFNRPVLTPITNFNKVTDAVVDEAGNLIFPFTVMKNKEKYLTNHPTVPSRGLLLIKLMIEKHIESICRWNRYSTFNNKILAHFTNEGYEIYNEGHIDKICESLFMQLNNFIGLDEWHIYFVKFIGLDILIEKTIDYRVYEWTREHGDSFKP